MQSAALLGDRAGAGGLSRQAARGVLGKVVSKPCSRTTHTRRMLRAGICASWAPQAWQRWRHARRLTGADGEGHGKLGGGQNNHRQEEEECHGQEEHAWRGERQATGGVSRRDPLLVAGYKQVVFEPRQSNAARACACSCACRSPLPRKKAK